jgi:hypothetical protein
MRHGESLSLNAESEASYLQRNLHFLLAKANIVCELPADRDSGQLRRWQGEDSASPSICSESKAVVLEMIEGRVCCGSSGATVQTGLARSMKVGQGFAAKLPNHNPSQPKTYQSRASRCNVHHLTNGALLCDCRSLMNILAFALARFTSPAQPQRSHDCFDTSYLSVSAS